MIECKRRIESETNRQNMNETRRSLPFCYVLAMWLEAEDLSCLGWIQLDCCCRWLLQVDSQPRQHPAEAVAASLPKITHEEIHQSLLIHRHFDLILWTTAQVPSRKITTLSMNSKLTPFQRYQKLNNQILHTAILLIEKENEWISRWNFKWMQSREMHYY